MCVNAFIFEQASKTFIIILLMLHFLKIQNELLCYLPHVKQIGTPKDINVRLMNVQKKNKLKDAVEINLVCSYHYSNMLSIDLQTCIFVSLLECIGLV